MAGLPFRSASVSVGPPFSASEASFGFAPTLSVESGEKEHPDIFWMRLCPLDVTVPKHARSLCAAPAVSRPRIAAFSEIVEPLTPRTPPPVRLTVLPDPLRVLRATVELTNEALMFWPTLIPPPDALPYPVAPVEVPTTAFPVMVELAMVLG
jgi:hypothetical protein